MGEDDDIEVGEEVFDEGDDFQVDFNEIDDEPDKEKLPSTFYENVDNKEDHFNQLSQDMAGIHAARFNSLLMEMKDSDFIKYYGMLLEYTRPKLQRVTPGMNDEEEDFKLFVSVVSNKPDEIVNFDEDPGSDDEPDENYNLEDND